MAPTNRRPKGSLHERLHPPAESLPDDFWDKAEQHDYIVAKTRPTTPRDAASIPSRLMALRSMEPARARGIAWPMLWRLALAAIVFVLGWVIADVTDPAGFIVYVLGAVGTGVGGALLMGSIAGADRELRDALEDAIERRDDSGWEGVGATPHPTVPGVYEGPRVVSEAAQRARADAERIARMVERNRERADDREDAG